MMDYFIDFANHCDTEVYFPGCGVIPLKRGQHIFGTPQLADFFGVDRGRIRRKLKILKNLKFLNIKTTNKYSIATVINYDTYQAEKNTNDQQNDQQPTSTFGEFFEKLLKSDNQNDQQKAIIISKKIKELTGIDITQTTSKRPAKRPATDQQATTPKELKELKNDDNGTPPTPPQGDKPFPTWKTDFNIYLEQCQRSYKELINSLDWVSSQEEINPGVDIYLTMKKAYLNYWGTEAAWKKKKRQKIMDINWKSTWQNALSQKMNRVYKDAIQKANYQDGARAPTPTTYAQCQDNEQRQKIALLRKLREDENNGRSQANPEGTNQPRLGLSDQETS